MSDGNEPVKMNSSQVPDDQRVEDMEDEAVQLTHGDPRHGGPGDDGGGGEEEEH